MCIKQTSSWGSVLALAIAAGQARAQPRYEFNTGDGTVTLNGSPIVTFQGVPIVNRGVAGGVRTWAILGNMVVPANAELKFTGSNLAKVSVGGHLSVPSSATFKASADARNPGPGGGEGGQGGSGGGPGGEGGLGGGGENIPGAAGQNASGSMGGLGGAFPRQGGPAGDGTMVAGIGGGAGFARGIGSNGATGQQGASGGGGAAGLNNPVGPPAGGGGGGGGIGGPGGSLPGGGGGGGAGGGGAGTPGQPGGPGNPGFSNAGNGLPGANAATLLPSNEAEPVLNGGNGGSGGGGGGAGGGGGGGTTGSGGGGGGGGNGDPVFQCVGGGGGGGGAGGSGGRGGQGGTGGRGGDGGGGGGGLWLAVQGRIDHAGTIAAKGGDFGSPQQGSNGSPGLTGAAGGRGGSPAGPSCAFGSPGGPGGDGGAGGIGGEGGEGADGANGGAGAGGTVFVSATLVAGAGSIDIAGGMGAVALGQPGRVLYSDAAAGSPGFVHVVNPVYVSRIMTHAPVWNSPYFAGLVTPNIVPSAAGGADIGGGPGPFGLLPASLADATISDAIANAPVGATVALVRFDLGPTGFDVGYNVTSATGISEAFDMLVLVNLTGTDTYAAMNGVLLSRLPLLARPEFGGDGSTQPVPLLAGRSWAVLATEFGSLSVDLAFPQGSVTVAAADPADNGATVTYVMLPPCSPDYNNDGNVDQDDVAYLINVVSGGVNPSGRDPDFNRDGNVDQDDVSALINVVAGGSCP